MRPLDNSSYKSQVWPLATVRPSIMVMVVPLNCGPQGDYMWRVELDIAKDSLSCGRTRSGANSQLLNAWWQAVPRKS
jgi:hypothetical protein